MMRRRRPLMRAAVIGGGAYMAGKHVARGQQAEADQNARMDDLEAQQQYQAPPQQYQAPPQQYQAPPPAAPAGGISDATIHELQELAKLKDQGILTQDEFDQQKQKLLSAT